MKNFKPYLEINPEINGALEKNVPIVALESTIISHGFNYPENLECANTCEKIIRENGAVPATIGIVNGKIKIGLTREEIEIFATNRQMPKCSRRDAAAIIAKGMSGATTVAATMLFASMAGIKIFATGGIGGVHRDAQQTFDISADLEELAQTNVAVVCAGAKSVLDISLTREYLETAGVPVLGYRTEDFPSFYTGKSGEKVDYRVETPRDIAGIIKIQTDLGLGGMLIANPIPEKDEMDHDFINECIKKALVEAKEKGIKGKAVTPFLLERLHAITEGKSVAANKALVYNNSKLAAQIAVELSEIIR